MRDILSGPDGGNPKDATRVAEPSRQSQLPKRFYKSVEVVEIESAHGIRLDGKPIKTPGRNNLVFESQKVAALVANEWRKQGERIDPQTMPATRLVNTALDGVAADPQAVKEDIVRFAGTDLLCYRGGGPEGLTAHQTEIWDPILDWAQATLGARFVLAEGVMHVAQPPESMTAFSVHVGQIDNPLVLASLHVMTNLTGSAVLAMAVLKGKLSVDEAWKAAHIDEDWNISQWGEDREAMALRGKRRLEIDAAAAIASATVKASSA